MSKIGTDETEVMGKEQMEEDKEKRKLTDKIMT
jgi:hypothetical protein